MNSESSASVRNCECKGKGGCPCGPCTGMTKKNEQCKNRTCYSNNLCWAHQPTIIKRTQHLVPPALMTMYNIQQATVEMSSLPFLFLDGTYGSQEVTVKVFTNNRDSAFFHENYWNGLMQKISPKVIIASVTPVQHIVYERLVPVTAEERKNHGFIEEFKPIVMEMVQQHKFFENMHFHNLMKKKSDNKLVMVGWKQVNTTWNTMKESLVHCGLCRYQQVVADMMKEPTCPQETTKVDMTSSTN